METRNYKVVLWLALALTLCIAGSTADAATYYVKTGANGANNGSSWANAFNDLQSALMIADWGDEIWIAAGTYKPTSSTDRNISFVLTAGTALYGGFSGTETTRDQRNWVLNKTILSGDIGVIGNNTDNSIHVVTGSYNATIDGLTITGSNNSGNGGGMYNQQVSLIKVNHCEFLNNYAKFGGGMYNSNVTSLTITDCTFSSNTATRGGGIYNDTIRSFTASDCTFIGNSANSAGGGMQNGYGSHCVNRCTFISNSAGSGYGGGGIYVSAGLTVVNQCDFIKNTSYYGGGGMYAYGGVVSIVGCAFISNSVTGDGGGLYTNYQFSSDQLLVSHCIFFGNSASDGLGGGMSNHNLKESAMFSHCSFAGNSAKTGGGIYNGGGSPLIKNSIVWGNTASSTAEIYNSVSNPILRNCNIRGSGGSGPQWDHSLGIDGGGNIMGNPLFVDAANPIGPDALWRTADDGLALKLGSPCLNAGELNSAIESDIRGNSPLGIPDIGAYEFQGAQVPAIKALSETIIPNDQVYTGPIPILIEGAMPIIWALVQGPTGMTINPSTGIVSWLTPTTAGSPFTVTIRATNAFGQADATWKLTVYHPGPPSKPQGGMEIIYHVKTPSVSPDGQPVQYTYVWTSDKGDRVTHGPTVATSDTLTEMNLVQDGETWTVQVTPTCGGKTGAAAFAKVKLVDIHSGVMVWSFYK